MTRSRVDLPAPLGPAIATSSPAPTARFTSCNAARAPCQEDTPCSVTSAPPARLDGIGSGDGGVRGRARGAMGAAMVTPRWMNGRAHRRESRLPPLVQVLYDPGTTPE